MDEQATIARATSPKATSPKDTSAKGRMPKLGGIHHVAYRCRDAKETVDFYSDLLGMDFKLAIAEASVPSTGEADPYMHVFLDAGDGNVLAFFELPNAPEMGRDEATPRWVQHIAFKVADIDSLEAVKGRAEARGLEVVGPTHHGIFKSVYFFDPSGHRVEVVCDVHTDEELEELHRVAPEMLEEWSQTKKPPRHAAWLHEKIAEEEGRLRLHAYYRSSTSYRVRIALNLKDLDYEIVPVDLRKAEQRSEAFRAKNRYASVPMLQVGRRRYAQSMAILEWLDEAYPDPPLLPKDIEDRAVARELAYAIATELHAPLNLPVLQYLTHELGQKPVAVDRWYHHWLRKTLVPLEERLADLDAGDFLFDAPGLFEAVLIPQLYNARRFGFNLDGFSHMCRIEAACLELPAFRQAHPDCQPDSPEEAEG